MARFCSIKGRLCFYEICTQHNECKIEEVRKISDHEDDENTFATSFGIGLAVASLFTSTDPINEPDGDTFTGGGGDFGGGGASDDF